MSSLNNRYIRLSGTLKPILVVTDFQEVRWMRLIQVDSLIGNLLFLLIGSTDAVHE
jgi:hypothetical protein